LDQLFNLKNILISFYFLLVSQTAMAAHLVLAAEAKPVSEVVRLTLMADVSNSPTDKITSLAGRNYRLSIQVPKGAVLDLSLGSTVSVILPTIHNRNALARVSSISKTRIELTLTNQVQLLEGQRLRVTLPAKPINLYQIPFQAIYSPRGLTTEVFVLSSDRRVHLVPVVPLQVFSDGKVIVSAEQLKGATIVVHGGDNLVSGDSVQIVQQKEAKL
jgi:multidrug efflux pump subunit AcrA (membrane-fusion protein)